jgi:hypothetical protein
LITESVKDYTVPRCRVAVFYQAGLLVVPVTDPMLKPVAEFFAADSGVTRAN